MLPGRTGYRPMDPSPRFELKMQQWEQTKVQMETRDKEALLATTLKRREELLTTGKERNRTQAEWEEHGRQLHRINMKTRRERELADAQWKERTIETQKELQQSVNEKTKMLMTDELDKFEERLTRMGLDAKSKRAQDNGMEEGADAIRKMVAAQSEVPFRHLDKLSAIAEKALADTKAESEQYLKRMQQRKVEDAEARKEREKRRRKMLLDQQKNFRSVEDKRRQDLLLQKLARISQQERAIAQELCEQAQWKELVIRNRLQQEEEYAKRRRQDAEEELQRQRDLAERERAEYLKQTEAESRRFAEMWASKQQRKRAKHYDMCRDVMDQVLDLVDHVVEYSERTGETRKALPGCTLVPKPLWQQWMAVFSHGQPIPSDPEPLSPGENIPGKLLDNEEAEITQLLNDADLRDYLEQTNDWAPSSSSAAPEEMFNTPLVAIMHHLQQILHPAPRPCVPPPSEKSVVVLLGKPLSGKSVVAADCAKALNLVYLSPVTLVEEATRQFSPEQDRMVNSFPEQQKELYGQFLSLGRQLRAQLLAGQEIKEESLIPLLVNRLRFLEYDRNTQGVLLDGLPATEAGFRSLERHLSGYDESRLITIPPKLLLPHPPITTSVAAAEEERRPSSNPPVPVNVSSNVSNPSDPSVRPTSRDRKQSVSKKAPKASAKPSKSEDPIPTTLPLQVEEQTTAESSVCVPHDGTPARDISGLDLVVHLLVPNSVIFARFAGQRQDPSNGQLYHVEYNPPPLDRMTALQPVDRPMASDQAMLQEKLLAHTHEIKRIRRWLSKYETLREVEADQPLPLVHSEVTNLLQEAIANKLQSYHSPKSVQQLPASVPEVATEQPKPCLGSVVPAEVFQQYENQIRPQLASLFVSQWDTVEVVFEKGSKQIFGALRQLRKAATEHLVIAREHFATFLTRPDTRQNEVTAFQADFNKIDRVLRADPDTKAELHLRTDQLQETLWNSIDVRREAGVTEIQLLRESEWLELHKKAARRQFLQLMQLEVDRCNQTRTFILDYFYGVCGFDNMEEVAPPELDLLHKPESNDNGKKGAKKADKKEDKAKDDKKDAKGGGRAADKGVKKGKAPAEEPVEEEDILTTAYNMAVTFFKAPLELGPVEDEEEKTKKAKAAKKGIKEEEDKTHFRPVPAGMREVWEAEGELCILRLARIRQKCAEFLEVVEQKNSELLQTLESWLIKRVQEEMESSSALVRTIRQSIEEENPLSHELRLDGTEFFVNEGLLLVQPTPPVKSSQRPQGSPNGRVLVSTWLTKCQSIKVAHKFRQMAPQGRVNKAGFTRLFLQLAATNHGQEDIPAGWTALRSSHFEKAFNCFDAFNRGVIDWREFMVSAVLWSNPTLPGSSTDNCNPFQLACPSMAQLVALRDAFRKWKPWNPEAYYEHVVTRAQFDDTPFWFQSTFGDILATQVKAVLWEAFHWADGLDSPRLHYPTLLLFLCSDPQVVRGTQKAFAMLSDSDGRLTRELLHELLHFNAATAGEMDDRDEFATDTIDAIFDDVMRASGPDVTKVSFAEVCTTHLGRVMLNQAKMFLKKEVQFT